MCVRVGFFWLAGVRGGVCGCSEGFEAGLRATDIVKNEGSEMRLSWRGAETFLKTKIFFCPFS